MSNAPNQEFRQLVVFRLREFVVLGERPDVETARLALEALTEVSNASDRRKLRDSHIRSAAALLPAVKAWAKAGMLLEETRQMRRNWSRYTSAAAPTPCRTVRDHLWAAAKFLDLPESQKQFRRVLDIADHCDVHGEWEI